MAKKALLTVDGTYRKVKKGLFTLDSVYRKVKKAYLTVGGVYRPCWGGGKVVYYGTAPNLSKPAYSLASSKVGNYALISGGQNGTSSSNMYKTVNTYDVNLTKGTATDMSVARYTHGGLFNDKYAIFAGGNSYAWANYLKSGDAYNASLTRSTPTALHTGGNYLSGCSLHEHALFQGGNKGASSAEKSKKVEAYNTSLTKTTLADLDDTDIISRGSVGNRALFLSETSTYVYDDETLTRTEIAQCGITSKMRGVSMGQYNLNASYDGSVAYDKDLVRTTTSSLSVKTSSAPPGACVDGNAVFAIIYDGMNVENVANIYDSSLTQTIIEPGLSSTRSASTSAEVGNFALFAGGHHTASRSEVVDAYTVV